MSTIEQRREQMFPKLTPAEVERLRRFGEQRRYAAGEVLFRAGELSPGMIVIISGAVEITGRDALGHMHRIVEHGPGEFSAEVGQLSGRSALVNARAAADVEALVIPPEGLRNVLVAEAELGERIMRALILRRVALIETGTGGPVLIGPADSPDIVRLQGFLARNGFPHQVVDSAEDPDAAALIERYVSSPADLPIAACPDGTVLRNPSNSELAHILGMVPEGTADRTYDVAVVGGGPSGLATAVYAASEGLSVIVLERCAYGGQAGASARIENYLGFPTGISGQALAGRAYVQAQKFGAEILIPIPARRLDCTGTPLVLELDEGRSIKASTVVVASGAAYRRPAIPNLPDFEGRGVWYWASPIEAKMCRNEEVVLVGGGNSAGQAAVFLSGFTRKIWMLVRRPGLEETMSRYLIDRIAANPSIELLTETELVSLAGNPEGHLSRVTWRHGPTGEETEKPIRNVFLFIGADPATEWLEDCGVAVDPKGFVLTGVTGAEAASIEIRGSSRQFALETNVAGVFAVGDVRSGSVKRVGAAIGEGAGVVAQLHRYLERAKRPRSEAPGPERASAVPAAK